MIGETLKKAIARRRKGAVALLTVVAMVPATTMLTASINSGQMIDDKRRTQDAADALASMHQTWAARSLNIISMNNVSAAQLTSVAVAAEALDHTMLELNRRAWGTLAWIGWHSFGIPLLGGGYCYGNIFTWVPYCSANHYQGSKPAWTAIGYTNAVRESYATAETVRLSHDALSAIGAMNEALVSRFPTAVRQIADDYKAVYRIDDYHFLDACTEAEYGCTAGRTTDGMMLPVERREALTTAERCHAMHFGNSLAGESGLLPNVFADLGLSVEGRHRRSFDARGFRFGEGPLTHGGSDRYPHLREHILNTVTVHAGLFSRIDEAFDLYKDTYEVLPFVTSWVSWDTLPEEINVQGTQSKDDNSFTRRFNWKLLSACLPLGHQDLDEVSNVGGAASWLARIVGQSEAALLVDMYRMLYEGPRPEAWWPEGRDLRTPIRTSIADMGDAYKVLVVTSKNTDKRRWGFDRTGDRLGDYVLKNEVTQHYGYAQAGLFNPDGADFYTQNWQYRLMPADRLDRPSGVAEELRDRAPQAFENLASALANVRTMASWGKINAH